MRFGILGPLQVVSDDDEPVALGGHRQRAMLAALLLHANAGVPSGRLIEELWGGEPPRSAAKTLQVYVSRIRHALGGDGAQRLETVPGGYRLRVEPEELDADQFEKLLRESVRLLAAGRPAAAGDGVCAALELWRGDPLSDLAYESFAQAEIARLEERRLAAEELRVDAELAVGRDRDAIASLRPLIGAHPYRERLRGRLMLALYRAGRQAEALAAYQDARETLVDALGIEPSAELRDLHAAILAQDTALIAEPPGGSSRSAARADADGIRAMRTAGSPPRALDRVRSNLPATVGGFFGRARELEDLAALCADSDRLVTLVGPGGTGKTRLAIELGHRLAERFDGVWLVSLEQIVRPGEVVGAIARTIGLPESQGAPDLDQVTDYLAERSVLLLLDNLEHLLDSAPAIERIAIAGGRTRVLGTSQAPLRTPSERVLRLDPLQLPGPETDPDAVAAVPAVQMLLERTAAAGVSLIVDETTTSGLVRLCHQLEGLPLAIELAAPRLGLLSPAALADRLESELDALGRGARHLPARQRGLRAVLEWTVGLLDTRAQTLLAQLAAFPGGFTVELAEAAFGEILEELMALLDVGLIRRDETGRLALRPPVRSFATELLRRDGDENETLATAADAIAALGERFERRWFVRAGEGRVLLAPEAGNVTFLLDWTREHDSPRHARLAVATGWWMNHSARTQYARDHLNLALAQARDPVLRARCLQALGTLGLAGVDPTDSLRAADAWHALGDIDGEVFSLLYAANLHTHRREGKACMMLVERAETVAAPVITGDEELRWSISMLRADGLWHVGPRDEAEVLLGNLLAQARPGSWRQFWAATKQADFALEAGRPAEALRLYGVAMHALEGLSTPLGEAMQADTIAAALLQLDRIDDATDVYAVCELAHDELAFTPAGVLGEILGDVKRRIDQDRLPHARRRASELGMTRALAWVGALARGELGGG